MVDKFCAAAANAGVSDPSVAEDCEIRIFWRTEAVRLGERQSFARVFDYRLASRNIFERENAAPVNRGAFHAEPKAREFRIDSWRHFNPQTLFTGDGPRVSYSAQSYRKGLREPAVVEKISLTNQALFRKHRCLGVDVSFALSGAAKLIVVVAEAAEADRGATESRRD
jgi:hypothetical protein